MSEVCEKCKDEARWRERLRELDVLLELMEDGWYMKCTNGRWAKMFVCRYRCPYELERMVENDVTS